MLYVYGVFLVVMVVVILLCGLVLVWCLIKVVLKLVVGLF